MFSFYSRIGRILPKSFSAMTMEDKSFREARKQVKKKKGFFVHLAVYLSVALFFLLINVATFDGEWWFFFPILPWGIGLAIHYLTVFGFPGTDILTDEWEKRELDRELYKRGYYDKANKTLPAGQTPVEDELDLNRPRKVREKQRPEEDEFV
jgi:hypothetical protein